MEKKRLLLACGIITLLAAIALLVIMTTMGRNSGDLTPEPATMTLSGHLTCLPHKNVQPGQPVTLECAIGLRTDNGEHYALEQLPAGAAETEFTKQVIVTGDVMAPDAKDIYDTKGTMTVKTFEAN